MTSPVLRMLRTSQFVAWYAAQYAAAGDPVTVVRSRGIGENLPSQPDRLVVVARTGGPGLAVEGTYDVPSYQIRWRGAANNADDAEALADLGDRLLVDAPMPALIGGKHINLITRVGSPPTEDRRDAGRRTHLTSNYLIHLARFAPVVQTPPVFYP